MKDSNKWLDVFDSNSRFGIDESSKPTWWLKMSPEEQSDYLKKHPNSDLAKEKAKEEKPKEEKPKEKEKKPKEDPKDEPEDDEPEEKEKKEPSETSQAVKDASKKVFDKLADFAKGLGTKLDPQAMQAIEKGVEAGKEVGEAGKNILDKMKADLEKRKEEEKAKQEKKKKEQEKEVEKAKKESFADRFNTYIK